MFISTLTIQIGYIFDIPHPFKIIPRRFQNEEFRFATVLFCQGDESSPKLQHSRSRKEKRAICEILNSEMAETRFWTG